MRVTFTWRALGGHGFVKGGTWGSKLPGETDLGDGSGEGKGGERGE